MPEQEMLKIAFERGMREAIDQLPITTSDADLVKEAIFRRMWGGVKKLFGRKPKVPTAPRPPVHPGKGATPEQLQKYTDEMATYSAQRMRGAGYYPAAGPEQAAAFAQKAGPEGRKWLETVGQYGATGALGGGMLGPTGMLLPTAAGAGLGYAVGGREGALTGAGIGLGARLGAGGLLQRLREARGYARALGRTPVPLGEMMRTAAGQKALMAGGAAGAGLGGAGYAIGRATRPPEEPWYSGLGLGLSPQQTQDISQLAMPLLSERLGLDPTVVQALGQQYGLVPQAAGYYPEETVQSSPQELGYY